MFEHISQVSGYVKAVSSAGVFVVLARNAEARVKMGHLSDSYVKDPKEAFPEGQLVEGRVISGSDGRCNPWTSIHASLECLPECCQYYNATAVIMFYRGSIHRCAGSRILAVHWQL